MFSTLLGMGGLSQPSAPAEETRARASSVDTVSTDRTIDEVSIDEVSNAQSSSSTPPTSIGDSTSEPSTSPKLDVPVLAASSTKPKKVRATGSRRSNRSSRTSLATYNVKVLAGTAIHAPKKYCKNNGDQATEATRRRTISGYTLVGTLASAKSSHESVQKDAQRLVSDGIAALDLQWSVKKLPSSKSQVGVYKSPKQSPDRSPKKSVSQNPRKGADQIIDNARRKSTRSAGDNISRFTQKLGAIGKRKFNDIALTAEEKALARAKRELDRLADTAEFAKIDTEPVVHEVWSNGKLVVPERPNKRKKLAEAEAAAAKAREEAKAAEPKKLAQKKHQKVWLDKGLYAGQDHMDWFKNYTVKPSEKEQLYDIAPFRPTGALPMPMWHGQRVLHQGRDFKLPFDVCAPLPPGQPKPDEWRKTSSNRFIGEAGALWKKSTLFDSFSSKCVCTPEGGCDVDCQNRIMLYECDDTNCGAGRANCTNRAFADLQERRKAGGKYRIGVEVIKTADRGYGVRSNRCFEPNQIIVEYTGEIITEDECDRRMNEDYKNNECYYLMSFDQNMIIDATKGSIARFVNHSCKPNSRMVKWIVGGKPRMALFAGDNPIMSGDELTYDYNFDPFSAKNVQECRCGSDNCRGVLGPKPKDPKPIKDAIKDTVKATVKAGKRKLKDLLGGDDDSDSRSPKKRKIKEAAGVKRSASSTTTTTTRVVNGAKAMKRTLSAQLLNARQAISSKKNVTASSKTTRKGQTNVSSRNSSMTIVNGSPGSVKAKRSYIKRQSMAKNIVRSMRGGRVTSETTIRVVPDGDGE